ncbi:prolipoprotein diacylglyceryl transferase family protein [Pelobium manganitolerans]|uniref:prolipoprotein diacylglyceryl transferase family protein n=1 Tax=Pelobium manganitolerans TaxID=1842495 RepID=UPI001C7E18D7
MHPAQLYEALSYFIIFFILLFLYRRDTVKIGNGFYFGLSIFLIFTMRVLIEFFKN